jgi:hypothetical protein
MSAPTGADVEALCSKCGDVWHVVVAKVGEQIVKVQCKQCGGYHRYKSPHGASKEVRQPSMFGPSSRSSAVRGPTADKAPVERFEKPAVAADLSKPSRTYRASEKFDVGERVDHPSFGQGVVEISEPGKITVFFASGRRVLVQAKDGGTGPGGGGGLSRPKPFDHSNAAGGKRVGDS